MKNKKLLLDIKEYLKYYENQVLEDWYELIRHISVSETGDRKSTRLNSSHTDSSRMPSSA